LSELNDTKPEPSTNDSSPPHHMLGGLISVTSEVNENLGQILRRTDSVIRRQNVLTALFTIALILMGCQIGLGLTLQSLLQSARTQLLFLENARGEIRVEVEAASRNMKDVQFRLEEMKKQLNSAPTVTADSGGRLNLEVQVDSKKTPNVPPGVDKVVIPLKPGPAKVSN
jgi:hypothetical protein